MDARTNLTHEIDAGAEGPGIGAFFDLDGTLIAGFSATAFYRDRLLSGQLRFEDVVNTGLSTLAFARGRVGFSAAMAAMAAMLRGTPEADLIETGERLFEEELGGLIYPESRALVHAHVRRGHTVVIVSAATRYQVEPIARDLDIEHVLCTELEVDDGAFTGRALRPLCWGEGKLQMARGLAEWAGVDLSQSWFYTDSADDLPLLQAVGHPRPTNPDARLDRIAWNRGWPVQRFRSRGRPGVGDVVRTLLAASALPGTVLMGLPALLTTGRRRPWLDFVTGAWGDLGSAIAGVELRVEGEEHLWSHRPAVFIHNHQSAIDALLLCKLLRRDLSAVARRARRRVPVLGAVSALAETVFIDRDQLDSEEAWTPAVEALQRGRSLVIPPEGSRTPTPRLAPFEDTAFRIALEAGVPIVPIVFRNAHDALPKHALVVRPCVIEAVVLPPVATEGWKREHLDEEIARIRDAYERILSD